MNELERIELMASLAKQSAELYADFDNPIRFLSADRDHVTERPAVMICGISELSKLLGVKPYTVELDNDSYDLVIMHNGVEFYEFFNYTKVITDDV